MSFYRERLKANVEEVAYKMYVSDSLYYIGGLNIKYRDIITPKKTDTRTGEEIMNDVVKKAGLKVI